MYSLMNGKVRQKTRTFNALVEAAAKLIGSKREFTVADAADLAGVGRTTAYRYFPSLEALKAQAVIWQVTRMVENHAAAILPRTYPPEERLASLIAMSDRTSLQYETEQRTMLRLSLETPEVTKGFPKRVGLRIDLVDQALKDLEEVLGKHSYERLRATLCLFIGIEASVVLRDVCQLDQAQAKEIKMWGAQQILRATLGEASAQIQSDAMSKSQVAGSKKASSQKQLKAESTKKRVVPAKSRSR